MLLVSAQRTRSSSSSLDGSYTYGSRLFLTTFCHGRVGYFKGRVTMCTSLLKGNIPLRDPSEVQKAAGPRRLDTSNLQQTKSEAQSAYEGAEGGEQQPKQPQRVEPVRTGRKIGRNEIVKVRYQNGQVVEAKYKKVEQDINSGACVLTS